MSGFAVAQVGLVGDWDQIHEDQPEVFQGPDWPTISLAIMPEARQSALTWGFR